MVVRKDQIIHYAFCKDAHQPLKKAIMLQIACVYIEGVAQMPIGGVQNAHLKLPLRGEPYRGRLSMVAYSAI